MNAIALPSQQILCPRFELPAWVRKISDPLRMGQIAAGGIYGGLNAGAVGVASGVAVPHWSTAGGALDASHIAAWTPKGAATLAASYTQYGTLASSFAVGVAPTWNATDGWIGNGSAWLNTGIVPTSASGSAIVRFSNKAAGDYFLFGESSGATTRFAVVIRSSSGGSHEYHNGGITSIAGNLTSGVIMFAGAKGYLNGTLETSTIPAWSGTNTLPIYLLARSIAGPSANSHLVGYVQAVAFYDIDVSAYASVLTTAINAL